MERTLAWDEGTVVAIDQCALPAVHRTLRLTSVDDVIDAIVRLAIRGAPAIGVAGGLGVALAARAHTRGGAVDAAAVRADAERLAAARPTAVNLAWGVRLALARLPHGADAVLAEALTMIEEDERTNRVMSAKAASVVRSLCPRRPLRVMTHCNTGGLATIAWGTALGAIRELAASGDIEYVLAGETRPLLQGARLTAWELRQAGIPFRLCADSAGPAAISRGMIDCVLVGADRVAANGDVANKIGTYSLACAAAHSGLPFIVVAPESTIDASTPDGAAIMIEERGADEVAVVNGARITVPDAPVFNPAFDITPHDMVTAVVTERGVHAPAGRGSPRSGIRSRDLSDVDTDAARCTRGAGMSVVDGDARTAARDLAAFCQALYRRGWLEGTSGNLSVRLDEPDRALITASGVSKGALDIGDTVVVRATTGGAVRPGARKPSAEAAIHAAIYRTLPDCQAVIHAHTPYATLAAARTADAGHAAITFNRYEFIKGFGLPDPSSMTVPVFTNWTNVGRIGDDVGRHIEAADRAGAPAPPVLLLAYHGATAWGATLAQARDRLECLEALCRLVTSV